MRCGLVLIDHYDSFSGNVLEWLRGGPHGAGGRHGGQSIRLVRTDDFRQLAQLLREPAPVILGPGPGGPEKTVLPIVARQLLGVVPLLGICLGHQALALLAGGSLCQDNDPWHGTTRPIQPVPGGALASLGPRFAATTYNSLVATFGNRGLRPGWRVAAHCPQGQVQALSYTRLGKAPALGVQFHPESFLTEKAGPLRDLWLDQVALWQARCAGPGQASAMAPLSMPS